MNELVALLQAKAPRATRGGRCSPRYRLLLATPREGGVPATDPLVKPLQIGDTVRLSRAFLQSSAMVTGPAAPTSVGPFARGTVTAISPISPGSSLVLATVAWADGESSQVNMANLELQPGNPPL